MYQIPQLDLASVFLAAQQAKANEQRMRFAEADARRQDEMYQQQQNKVARQEIQEQDRQRADAERQRFVFETRGKAAQGDVEAIAKLAEVAPDDPWLKNANAAAVKRREEMAATEKEAVAAKQWGSEQARRDYSPDLIEVSNSFGLTPEQGMRDQRVQQAMRKMKAHGPNQDKPMRLEYSKLANSLGSRFEGLPQVKNAAEIARAVNGMLGTSNNGQGDMAMLYSFTKALDPGSVVRESEYGTALASGGFRAKVESWLKKLQDNKGQLPDDVRESFRQEARKIAESYKSVYDPVANHYRKIAEAQGVDPSQVVPPSIFDSIKPVPQQGAAQGAAQAGPGPIQGPSGNIDLGSAPDLSNMSDEELIRIAGGVNG